jgi:hypothetical protein
MKYFKNNRSGVEAERRTFSRLKCGFLPKAATQTI